MVRVTNSFNCGSADTILVTFSSSGDTTGSIPGKLLIYPNPFTGKATVAYAEGFEGTTLILYDIARKEVRRLSNISGKTFMFDRAAFESGMYFLRLMKGNTVVTTEKVVIF
jgi:hypothetical protein